MNSLIPIIDVGWFLPENSSTKESEEELEKLKSALTTWGCFQAIGHEIPNLRLSTRKRIFEQPVEEKKKYAKEVTDMQGYGADPVPEEGQSLDCAVIAHYLFDIWLESNYGRGSYRVLADVIPVVGIDPQDYYEQWTVFKSAVHRVISNEKRNRVSVAIFYTPETRKQIGPIEGLINANAPRLFKSIKDYAEIHFGFYRKGMRSLHTAQV
ncbi:hypothetical protein RD792_004656 [Penstemon davidsonii]|uniref:Non-haem dioxygenase N-terminal domain-containing protein n=1 Tax=Penstemon davidsonii TaxID=160366 RepID=A0ABR0DI06_9LAMI|nr:hypothetical protein RD792_004656 [Penstemon davidsonii]